MPGLECHLRYGSKDNGETFMKGKDNWKKQKECHRVWKLLKKCNFGILESKDLKVKFSSLEEETFSITDVKSRKLANERRKIWRMKWCQLLLSSFFLHCCCCNAEFSTFSVLLYWNSIFLAITIGSNLLKRTALQIQPPERPLWRCHL